jgi:hypothetical protein
VASKAARSSRAAEVRAAAVRAASRASADSFHQSSTIFEGPGRRPGLFYAGDALCADLLGDLAPALKVSGRYGNRIVAIVGYRKLKQRPRRRDCRQNGARRGNLSSLFVL